MSTLLSRLQVLAFEFATGVLEAVVSSPLEEILGSRAAGKVPTSKAPAATRASSGRLARRSDEDIAKVVERIVTLVKGNPDGLRAEQIREELGLEAKEIARPIADALSSRQIKKSGNKRATTYFAAAGKSTAKSKPAKKPKAKAAVKAKPKAKPKAKAKSAKKATKAKAASAASTTNGVAAS